MRKYECFGLEDQNSKQQEEGFQKIKKSHTFGIRIPDGTQTSLIITRKNLRWK